MISKEQKSQKTDLTSADMFKKAAAVGGGKTA